MRNFKRFLVLSVDYEIFGNGTGDVRQHVVEPAERMARLCERYKVPLTVFVETEELVAFRRYPEELQRDLGYEPASVIEEQVASFASRGHDIQLHLHPEWFGAEYRNRRWSLRPDKGTIDSLHETADEAEAHIRERKALLEKISGQKVTAYRAGAFSAQPGRKLLRALEVSGITIDSSVVKGLTRSDEYTSFDYRSLPPRSIWRVGQDVTQADEDGAVWEIPIYSVRRRRYQQATWRRLRAKFSSHVPKERQADMMQQFKPKGGVGQFLRMLAQPVPMKLDFHNVSPWALLRWIKAAPEPSPGLPDVLVAIGHTKEHIDDSAFEKLLRLVTSDVSLEIVSFDAVAKLLTPHPRSPSILLGR